jgi:hypothetical protein
MRKDLSTADGHRSGIQETISEFPPADENAVVRSQLSAGISTDENANTTFNYPAGRNDIGDVTYQNVVLTKQGNKFRSKPN